jgi:hypothetical protein
MVSIAARVRSLPRARRPVLNAALAISPFFVQRPNTNGRNTRFERASENERLDEQPELTRTVGDLLDLPDARRRKPVDRNGDPLRVPPTAQTEELLFGCGRPLDLPDHPSWRARSAIDRSTSAARTNRSPAFAAVTSRCSSSVSGAPIGARSSAASTGSFSRLAAIGFADMIASLAARRAPSQPTAAIPSRGAQRWRARRFTRPLGTRPADH